MSKSEKKYWKYTFEEAQKGNFKISNHADLSAHFALGKMKVVKKSNDLLELSDSEVLFDNDTGRMKSVIANSAHWGRPEVQCPDCDGNLHINKKFFKIGSPHSPWFYICSNRMWL